MFSHPLQSENPQDEQQRSLPSLSSRGGGGGGGGSGLERDHEPPVRRAASSRLAPNEWSRGAAERLRVRVAQQEEAIECLQVEVTLAKQDAYDCRRRLRVERETFLSGQVLAIERQLLDIAKELKERLRKRRSGGALSDVAEFLPSSEHYCLKCLRDVEHHASPAGAATGPGTGRHHLHAGGGGGGGGSGTPHRARGVFVGEDDDVGAALSPPSSPRASDVVSPLTEAKEAPSHHQAACFILMKLLAVARRQTADGDDAAEAQERRVLEAEQHISTLHDIIRKSKVRAGAAAADAAAAATYLPRGSASGAGGGASATAAAAAAGDALARYVVREARTLLASTGWLKYTLGTIQAALMKGKDSVAELIRTVRATVTKGFGDLALQEATALTAVSSVRRFVDRVSPLLPRERAGAAKQGSLPVPPCITPDGHVVPPDSQRGDDKAADGGGGTSPPPTSPSSPLDGTGPMIVVADGEDAWAENVGRILTEYTAYFEDFFRLSATSAPSAFAVAASVASIAKHARKKGAAQQAEGAGGGALLLDYTSGAGSISGANNGSTGFSTSLPSFSAKPPAAANLAFAATLAAGKSRGFGLASTVVVAENRGDCGRNRNSVGGSGGGASSSSSSPASAPAPAPSVRSVAVNTAVTRDSAAQAGAASATAETPAADRAQTLRECAGGDNFAALFLQPRSSVGCQAGLAARAEAGTQAAVAVAHRSVGREATVEQATCVDMTVEVAEDATTTTSSFYLRASKEDARVSKAYSYKYVIDFEDSDEDEVAEGEEGLLARIAEAVKECGAATADAWDPPAGATRRSRAAEHEAEAAALCDTVAARLEEMEETLRQKAALFRHHLASSDRLGTDTQRAEDALARLRSRVHPLQRMVAAAAARRARELRVGGGKDVVLPHTSQPTVAGYDGGRRVGTADGGGGCCEGGFGGGGGGGGGAPLRQQPPPSELFGRAASSSDNVSSGAGAGGAAEVVSHEPLWAPREPGVPQGLSSTCPLPTWGNVSLFAASDGSGGGGGGDEVVRAVPRHVGASAMAAAPRRRQAGGEQSQWPPLAHPRAPPRALSQPASRSGRRAAAGKPQAKAGVSRQTRALFPNLQLAVAPL